MKIVHTNLFSNTAYDVMRGIMYRLTNQRCGKAERCAMVSKVKRDLNNEVIIEIDDNSYRYTRSTYWKFDHSNKPFADQVLDFYANYLKNNIVGKYYVAWKRDNTENKIGLFMDYHSDSTLKFSVQECYFIYDFLKHRKNLNRRYPADVIKKICGEEFDPILTEQNRMVQEELAKLEKEKEEAHTKRREQYNLEYKAFVNQLDKKDKELQNTIDTEFENKKAEILKTLEEFKSLAA